MFSVGRHRRAGRSLFLQIHRLTPEEVTIAKGGQITFQIHGGGHAFAIYEVSKDTTRQELGQFLCEGPDPAGVTAPLQHRCNLLPENSNVRHTVTDGKATSFSSRRQT